MASTQGVGAANEDTVHVSPTGVVVLDGLSAPKGLPMGCVHGTPWFVRQLGTTLINLIGDDEVSLQEALRVAITEVNDLHRDTCDLDQEAVPASTVVMIRERALCRGHRPPTDSLVACRTTATSSRRYATRQ
ncbi:hypothetical protein [Streptomyces sp. NPDC058394]|uniref:hypothetical protein n=1 Tax=Streptomyces sp. NPDC058394 TaxID=3346477 RepID=UPI00364A8C05